MVTVFAIEQMMHSEQNRFAKPRKPTSGKGRSAVGGKPMGFSRSIATIVDAATSARFFGRTRAATHDSPINGFWSTSPILAWVKSQDLRYLNFSGAFYRALGDAPKDWLGKTDLDIHPAELAAVSRQNDLAVLASNEPTEAVESLPGTAGGLDHFLIIRFPFTDPAGERRLAGICVRIARQKMREYELARRALMDELTGLYNRDGFMAFAEHELLAVRRRRSRCAVVYAEVEGLPQVNERLGRHQSDVLLVGTAIMLRDAFADGAVLGRLRGGAFAAFLPDPAHDAKVLKEHLRERLATFPFSDAQRTALHLSIGAAFTDAHPDAGLAALVAAAERARDAGGPA